MFHVGQKVERIGGYEEHDPGFVFPPLYTPLTVSWVGPSGCWGEWALDLVEYPAPESDEWLRGYNIHFFRPIVERKTDIGIFNQILLDASRRRELVDELS